MSRHPIAAHELRDFAARFTRALDALVDGERDLASQIFDEAIIDLEALVRRLEPAERRAA